MGNVNKGLATILLCAMVIAPSVCGASYAGSTDDVGYGGAETEFPDKDKAVIKEGTFPTLDHLRNMAPGLTKNQVYELLGRPHFREGVFGVREWNYIFHFRINGQILTCQYKVLYDADKRTQSTHWLPAGCAGVLAEREAQVAAPAPAAAKAPTHFNLSGDALFAYSKSGLPDILEDGRTQLAAIVEQLKSANAASIQVVGYTDRIGSDSANLALSLRRAETVREFLVRSGVPADSIVARGAGESGAVTQCPDSLGKQELVACLQPDRRVELIVSASN